jgi:DNA helicase-4
MPRQVKETSKMQAVSKEILPNFIGKLLGYKQINHTSESFIVSHKKSGDRAYSLTPVKSFAKFETGLLGGKLNLVIGGDVITCRFLQTKNANHFIEGLNHSILEFIKDYLIQVFSEFRMSVVNQYPRDSWACRINALLENLYQNYHAQSHLWRRYLNENDVKIIDECLLLYPFSIEKARDYHEQYQLKVRGLFYDLIEANPLTIEQRLGVIRSNDRNMVLAAAGTGKTSVMVAKALDIIDRGLAKPSEILILAYNRSAANELKERLSDKAKKGNLLLDVSPFISTFHALGRQILKESGIPTLMSVFAEDKFRLKQWVTNWIYEYIATDPSRVFDLVELTTPPVDPFEFQSKGEYERYLRDNEFRTLNNELVKGYQELLIANFLFVNQIPYQYEAAYVSKRRLEAGYDYKPDFHIKNTKIYIEHFGINRSGDTRPDIDKSKYNAEMRKKRDLHRECGTKLVETFHYEWQEGILLEGLKTKLINSEVQCKPMHPSEIFEKLNDQQALSGWSDLMTKALQAIRVERLEQEQIEDRFKNAGIHQPKKYAALLNKLHEGYVQELANQNTIDFDDMIIRAKQAVDSKEYSPEWKYILVDEFQDISSARMEFIKALLDKGPSPSLTVVGDDWQSIYRFSGGKLELTTRFGQLVGPYTETKLQKTFRYNNSIAGTAGQFIMENPEQYKKHIDTHSKVAESQVYLLDDKVGNDNGVYERTLEVVKKIRSHESTSSIAIIGRYNYLLDESKTLLWKEKFKDNIHFWSFHKSKGLEADYCILIGFFQGKSGFPNENRDDAIVEALLPSMDGFKHSEERRLLYVGITRAKNKCYIIADPTSPSEFITEMLAPKYNLNIVSKTFQDRFRQMFKCPNCEDGFFRKIIGKFGAFYACSTGRGCKVGKARVCAKCEAPSVDLLNTSECSNPGCKETLKICNLCGRPMKLRKGKYGEFWGCSGYGVKSDQCSNTARA